jgi:hypothetical protein
MLELLQAFAATVLDKGHLSAGDLQRFCNLCIDAHGLGLVPTGRQIADVLSSLGFSAPVVLRLSQQYERYAVLLARARNKGPSMPPM